MELFEITIQPLSGFGTPLKGDTLWGQFCWQARYDDNLLDGGLEKQISLYREKPFAIFSSAFPKITADNKTYYALKRPSLPAFYLFPFIADRKKALQNAKENKKKKWILVESLHRIDTAQVFFLTEKELAEKISPNNYSHFTLTTTRQHNTINRLTGTTGKDIFAPYSQENSYYLPGILLAVFVLIDEEATSLEKVITGLERIGTWGFGRDASTGMGKFNVVDHKPIPIADESDTVYSLAPSVPDMDMTQKSFVTTFTRFGKHGDSLACSSNPFKNPVIMADEAAVYVLKKPLNPDMPYLGKAVANVSKALPETIVQGYTPCLPIKLEQNL